LSEYLNSRSNFAAMFPFNIALYAIVTFVFSVFGLQSNSSTIDPTIFSKSIEISDTLNSKNFNNIITAYQEFYDNSCKHLSIKMGDITSIEQRMKLKSHNGVLEIVYDERIQRERNHLKMNVEIVDLYFYNKRRTKFEKLKSENIRRNSKRGNMLQHCKEDIKVKCEKLLTHLASI